MSFAHIRFEHGCLDNKKVAQLTQHFESIREYWDAKSADGVLVHSEILGQHDPTCCTDCVPAQVFEQKTVKGDSDLGKERFGIA